MIDGHDRSWTLIMWIRPCISSESDWSGKPLPPHSWGWCPSRTHHDLDVLYVSVSGGGTASGPADTQDRWPLAHLGSPPSCPLGNIRKHVWPTWSGFGLGSELSYRCGGPEGVDAMLDRQVGQQSRTYLLLASVVARAGEPHLFGLSWSDEFWTFCVSAIFVTTACGLVPIMQRTLIRWSTSFWRWHGTGGREAYPV